MAATVIDPINNNNNPQPILFDAKLFSAPDLEDTTDVDGTTVIEKESSKNSIINQPWSEVSTNISSVRKKTKTRTYKYIQLEHALTAANLLKTEDQRMRFNIDYLNSIQDNRFDEFLEVYYQKIRDYYDKIKKNDENEKARIFTFFDLEKKFLALDPTRDVKILFLDQSTSTKPMRSLASAHQRAVSASVAADAAVETFYARRAEHLIKDQSKARDEITVFARRTAERLQERLPCLMTMSHQVKIVDERDMKGQQDVQVLRQLKHKRALSMINKRRNIVLKMIAQTRKNQIKMEEQPMPVGIDKAACCRELLERANQIDCRLKEKKIQPRPQTATVRRRIPTAKTSSTFVSDNTSTTLTMKTDVSSSIPYQDSLSISQLEQIQNVRVLRPTRPLTAPTRVNWKNYC